MNGHASTAFNCLLNEQKQWRGGMAVQHYQPGQNVMKMLKMQWSNFAAKGIICQCCMTQCYASYNFRVQEISLHVHLAVRLCFFVGNGNLHTS